MSPAVDGRVRSIVVAVAVTVITQLALANVAEAKKHRKHHAGAASRTTARLHGKHRVKAPPADTTQPTGLEPELKITSPTASSTPAPEPATISPPAKLVRTEVGDAPAPPPHEAPVDLNAHSPEEPRSSSSENAASANAASANKAPEPARVDLSLREAPPPAMLTSAVPPPRAPRELPGHRRWGMFAGGLVMFLVGYGADIGLTYGLNHQPGALSLIPIAGPLIQTRDSWAMVAPSQTGNQQIDGPANQRIAAANGDIQNAAYAVLAVDAAIQLVGATLSVAGVVGKTHTKYASLEPSGNGVRVRF